MSTLKILNTLIAGITASSIAFPLCYTDETRQYGEQGMETITNSLSWSAPALGYVVKEGEQKNPETGNYTPAALVAPNKILVLTFAHHPSSGVTDMKSFVCDSGTYKVKGQWSHLGKLPGGADYNFYLAELENNVTGITPFKLAPAGEKYSNQTVFLSSYGSNALPGQWLARGVKRAGTAKIVNNPGLSADQPSDSYGITLSEGGKRPCFASNHFNDDLGGVVVTVPSTGGDYSQILVGFIAHTFADGTKEATGDTLIAYIPATGDVRVNLNALLGQ